MPHLASSHSHFSFRGESHFSVACWGYLVGYAVSLTQVSHRGKLNLPLRTSIYGILHHGEQASVCHMCCMPQSTGCWSIKLSQSQACGEAASLHTLCGHIICSFLWVQVSTSKTSQKRLDLRHAHTCQMRDAILWQGKANCVRRTRFSARSSVFLALSGAFVCAIG